MHTTATEREHTHTHDVCVHENEGLETGIYK